MDRALMAYTYEHTVELLFYRPDGSFYLRRQIGCAGGYQIVELTAEQVRNWLIEEGFEDRIEIWREEFGVHLKGSRGCPGSFLHHCGAGSSVPMSVKRAATSG